jgi:ABC-type Na+ efflux pump permease subunit
MFLVVLLSAGPLMQSVLEEKMYRIAEILVSSIPATALLFGKLIAATLVSLTLLGVYGVGGFVAAAGAGVTTHFDLYQWACIIAFQLLALTIYGSLFLAVGSACNDLKDSQTLTMPVMALVTIPLVLVHWVMSDPNGTVSTVLSLIPFFTPFLMLLRVTLEPGAPTWQVLTSLGLTALTAWFSIRISARIFRIGMLSQGSTPSFRELARWLRNG